MTLAQLKQYFLDNKVRFIELGLDYGGGLSARLNDRLFDLTIEDNKQNIISFLQSQPAIVNIEHG
jgi:hypothetical protein